MNVDPAVADVVSVVARMRGVVGVALGGSRAAGKADRDSDWDLGVYYRGGLDTTPLERFGTVHGPGGWGRIMNGGAWLHHRRTRVDVLFRDVDVVAHWTAAATRGEYEVDGLLGYLAGIPTYTLAAELAVNRQLAGAPPAAVAFPEALAATAGQRWRFGARFTLEQAATRARRGDVTTTLGHLARATVEAAHAVLCDRRQWMINEKGLIERAGLDAVHRRLATVTSSPDGLRACVDAVEGLLVDALTS